MEVKVEHLAGALIVVRSFTLPIFPSRELILVRPLAPIAHTLCFACSTVLKPRGQRVAHTSRAVLVARDGTQAFAVLCSSSLNLVSLFLCAPVSSS